MLVDRTCGLNNEKIKTSQSQRSCFCAACNQGSNQDTEGGIALQPVCNLTEVSLTSRKTTLQMKRSECNAETGGAIWGMARRNIQIS